MEMYKKKCIDNCFRIKSLSSESESNRIVRCQEIPTPSQYQNMDELPNMVLLSVFVWC